MGRKPVKNRVFSFDFETTVYEGQEDTQVWACGAVELFTDNFVLLHSIDETFQYILSLDCNCIIYFHNLKFDGSFWLSYFLTELELKQAFEVLSEKPFTVKPLKNSEMKNKTFKYSISDRGMFYTITIKYNNHIIEIRDSLKLLPFSVKTIGESFGTKHKKLDMEYEGLRYPNCPISEEEAEYIKNDCFVVKEALEIMYEEKHTKLTIGSCCLSEYKNILKASTKTQLTYDEMFPDMYDILLHERFREPTAGDYIRKSYRGGWCYLVKGKENKIYSHGVTADVNSLYPSMMHSESGNRYPIGRPKFWYGNFIPDEALAPNKYYFVRVKTRFYIKDGKLPFIQLKNNLMYKRTESLETSDVLGLDGKYYPFYRDKDDNIKDTRVTLTLTMSDYELLKEHYELVDFEIISGCWFYSEIGIFDEYIDKYKQMKLTSKGAKKQLAKLFLNNLYGKMASSQDSSFKYAYVKEDGSIGFIQITEHDKEAGYIPVGSAITSYARCFTIRAAQKNYHGKDKRGFIYADTDSIHCDLSAEEVQGITVHDKNFCCWKLESYWDTAIFTRQKTYIEHITHEDGIKIEKPYYNIKCAGMPDKCKKLFELSMTGDYTYEDIKTPEEKEFLFTENGEKIQRTLSDFKVGLKIWGKLIPKRIRGGILLVPTTYEMR